MTDTHEKFMGLAETRLDLMCCNVPEAGDVREESIKDIARALSQAHQDGILEGKRQAAEIARKHFDLRHADKARFASAAISSAILSTIPKEGE